MKKILQIDYFYCPYCHLPQKTHIPTKEILEEKNCWEITAKCTFCGKYHKRYVYPDGKIIPQKTHAFPTEGKAETYAVIMETEPGEFQLVKIEACSKEHAEYEFQKLYPDTKIVEIIKPQK